MAGPQTSQLQHLQQHPGLPLPAGQVPPSLFTSTAANLQEQMTFPHLSSQFAHCPYQAFETIQVRQHPGTQAL